MGARRMASRVFYLSFKIAEDATYAVRYGKLIDAINECIQGFQWSETTSFVLFQSSMGADEIAARIQSAISPKKDLVILGSPTTRLLMVIGKNDSDILESIVEFAVPI
jgi:hypothetical protein